MSESGSVKRQNLQVDNSGSLIRYSRSEPAIRTCDKATSPMTMSKESFLRHHAVPFRVWFLKACTQKLQTALKVLASLLTLLLVTCLVAMVLPYTGLPAVADQLPNVTEFGQHLLRMIQNFFMGNVKKKHRLRVYQF